MWTLPHQFSNSTNNSIGKTIPDIMVDNGTAATHHAIANSTTNQSLHDVLGFQNSSSSNTTGNTTDPNANLQINWLGFPKMDNFVDVFSVCCSVAVIFGGLIPYIPQYLKIKRSKNSDGFSTYANILRIMFWFGHHFELPLLIQSFVMIAGMMAMMEICIRVKDKRSSYTISAIGLGSSTSHRRRRFRIGKLNEFIQRFGSLESSSSSESFPINSAPVSSNGSSNDTSLSSFSFHHEPTVRVAEEESSIETAGEKT
ncbi:hypothetical protein SUGI_1488510 [Cryptomeria japonica]|uniref:Uncharacterized protein n=1 Tax=Cryptomeria japonica TaxID=3369 RepID=A0AAD3NNJ9_CRYJA|nr:hypothetical protein SUGI_1488510 [Cryptomeria japonica]